MARARSTGGSPAKKSGKTPARHTTPRKKSKTPRKGKSPAAKRGRSRSVSKSRASPKKSGRKPSVRKSPGRKSLSKSPSGKSTPTRTPRRSRSRSQNKGSARRTPSVTQKIKEAAQVIEHKIATPVQSFASSLRSRRAAHDQALKRLEGPSYVTSTASRRQPAVQPLIQRIRNCCRVPNCLTGIRRRLRWNNVKRHLKKNWARYVVLIAATAGAYYSYQNKKYLEKVVNEQYNKLADLIQQQKGSTFSKYFSGWFDESSTTTQQPPTIPPRTVDQQQVPQPPHHSTQTGGK